MITTASYPELDEAHSSALFAAMTATLSACFDAVGSSADAWEDGLLASLPPAWRHEYDAQFLARFTISLATVAWKLSEPEHVYDLASRAEEIALKYIVDTAERMFRERAPDQVPDFDLVRERLFEDDEYAELWESQAPSGSTDNWFEPFRPAVQVHPFTQQDAEPFVGLWADPESLDEIEDPEMEVFLILGEDWLDAPDEVIEEIPAILEETRSALFPQARLRQLGERDRTRLFDSAAEDVRVLLEKARRDGGLYDVWAVNNTALGAAPGRYRIHAGVPLEEALSLRRLVRAAEYRGATNVSLRVYREQHAFGPNVPELGSAPEPELGEYPDSR